MRLKCAATSHVLLEETLADAALTSTESRFSLVTKLFVRSSTEVPMCCSSHTMGAPAAWKIAFTASAISGPMPSPGNSVAARYGQSMDNQNSETHLRPLTPSLEAGVGLPTGLPDLSPYCCCTALQGWKRPIQQQQLDQKPTCDRGLTTKLPGSMLKSRQQELLP